MAGLNRDLIFILKIVASGLTAVFLIFFISALSGEDLLKNHGVIRDLERISADIAADLNGGIDRRVRQLGEAPQKNPYRKFYAAELAKEIHEVAYLTEKQKIMFDQYSVRDFEGKSRRLVAYSESADVPGLMSELDIVKRELKNSVNLIENRRDKLARQRMAYLALFFILWAGFTSTTAGGSFAREQPSRPPPAGPAPSLNRRARHVPQTLQTKRQALPDHHGPQVPVAGGEACRGAGDPQVRDPRRQGVFTAHR